MRHVLSTYHWLRVERVISRPWAVSRTVEICHELNMLVTQSRARVFQIMRFVAYRANRDRIPQMCHDLSSYGWLGDGLVIFREWELSRTLMYMCHELYTWMTRSRARDLQMMKFVVFRSRRDKFVTNSTDVSRTLFTWLAQVGAWWHSGGQGPWYLDQVRKMLSIEVSSFADKTWESRETASIKWYIYMCVCIYT